MLYSLSSPLGALRIVIILFAKRKKFSLQQHLHIWKLLSWPNITFLPAPETFWKINIIFINLISQVLCSDHNSKSRNTFFAYLSKLLKAQLWFVIVIIWEDANNNGLLVRQKRDWALSSIVLPFNILPDYSACVVRQLVKSFQGNLFS